MQVNQELLDREIASVSQQLETLKAQAAQAAGALAVLQGLRQYMDKEEPKAEEPSQDISDENKAIQDAVDKRSSFAKLVQNAEEEVLIAEDKNSTWVGH